MILLYDTIKKIVGTKGNYITLYRAFCNKCQLDRGYLAKQNAHKLFCRKCAPRHTSDSKSKISQSKIGKTPWNKGKLESRQAVKDKISKSKKGQTPPNKGKTMTFEQKIKLSCAAQGIDISDFTDLKTPEQKALRNKFADSGLHIQCFERDKYICQVCQLSHIELNAHHIESWKHFPDLRFELNNLISLCKICHLKFHKDFGSGKSEPNTKAQIESFKKTCYINPVKKTIYLVAGAPGAGKSWVCNQIKDKAEYVSYDGIKHRYARAILWQNPNSTVVYDPMTHVSSFITRNADIFDIKLLVIIEDEATVRSRLQSRSGNFTESVARRIRRMKSLARRAEFYGTSSEVLNYLTNQLA